MTNATTPPRQSLYDFPAWYDTLHTQGSAAEADLCLKLAQRFSSESQGGSCKNMRWIEPGCGTGRLIRALARRGQDAVGVDVNDAMITYASNRSPVPTPSVISRQIVAKSGKTLSLGTPPKSGHTRPTSGRATYIVGDITRLKPSMFNGLFDAAYCPHNTLRHLHDDTTVISHLRAMRSIMKKKSVYFVGINLAEGDVLFPAETNWTGTRGGLRVHEVMQFEPVRRDGRWVEQAQGVVVIQKRRTTPRGKTRWVDHETLLTSYDLWCGGVQRWQNLVAKAGLRETGVFDEHGDPSPSRENVYQIRVLRPQ